MSTFHPVPSYAADKYIDANQYVRTKLIHEYYCKFCGWTPRERFGCIPAMEQHVMREHGAPKPPWISVLPVVDMDCYESVSRQLAEAERVLANIDSGTPDYREQAAAYFRDREGEKEDHE